MPGCVCKMVLCFGKLLVRLRLVVSTIEMYACVLKRVKNKRRA